jgi:hypothetical protein
MTGQSRFRPGDQPPPVPNDNPSIHDLLIDDLSRVLAPEAEKGAARALVLARKELGLERYQTILQAGNHRSWQRDATDELADFCAYIKQGTEEGAAGLELEQVYWAALHMLCRVAGMEGGDPS